MRLHCIYERIDCFLCIGPDLRDNLRAHRHLTRAHTPSSLPQPTLWNHLPPPANGESPLAAPPLKLGEPLPPPVRSSAARYRQGLAPPARTQAAYLASPGSMQGAPPSAPHGDTRLGVSATARLPADTNIDRIGDAGRAARRLNALCPAALRWAGVPPPATARVLAPRSCSPARRLAWPMPVPMLADWMERSCSSTGRSASMAS